MKGLAVPSKAYFSLAADKPILAVMDEESEISLMVEEEEIGWVCPAGDPIALAKIIDHICDEDLTKYSGKLQQLAETKYSEEAILNRLTDVIGS
jgi:glycosyltransferase involved in cell wall biosynthesis